MSYESRAGFNDRISSVRIFRRAEVSLFNDQSFVALVLQSRIDPDLRYWRLPRTRAATGTIAFVDSSEDRAEESRTTGAMVKAVRKQYTALPLR